MYPNFPHVPHVPVEGTLSATVWPLSTTNTGQQVYLDPTTKERISLCKLAQNNLFYVYFVYMNAGDTVDNDPGDENIRFSGFRSKQSP